MTTTVVLIATTAIQATVALAALTLPAMAPVIAQDLGVPSSMVGTYLSFVYVGAAMAALLSGSLVLRHGAIRVSQIALCACAAALLLGLTPLLLLTAVSAILLGLGYGPITPSSSHVLARTTPLARMGLTLSLKQTGVPAGAALAGVLLPPMTVAFGWRPAVAVVAGACVAVAVAVQPLRAALDADRDRQARVSLRQLIAGLRLVASLPRLRTLAAVSFIYAGMQMCTSGFIVAYLAEEVGVSLISAGLGLTVANIAGVFARILWGAVADRWLAPRITLALLGWLMAATSGTVALFAASWPLAAMLTVLAMLGATAIGWNGVFLAEVARVAPAGQAGLATGGCLFFTFAGVVTSPLLFGALQRASGSYALCFAAAAAVCAVVGIVLAARNAPRAARSRAPD